MNAHSGAGFDAPEPFRVNNSYGASGASSFAHRTEPRPRRRISGFWIFMLSFLPGLNYMVMGLMKRGLFFMSAFFGMVYLVDFFHFLAFPLAILFFASLCDSQSKRRRINNGEHVPDDIDDIMRFAIKYKTPLLIAAAFLILIRILNFSGPLLAIVVCLLGWYFIKNRTGKFSKNDEAHNNH